MNGYGTFERIAGDKRSEAITSTDTEVNFGTVSTTPIESGGDEKVKVDLMGCERSTNLQEVTCHVNYTNLGDLDKKIGLYANTMFYSSALYDSHDDFHVIKKVMVADVDLDIGYSGFAETLLVAGVPTLVKYQYSTIKPERGLSTLKLSFSFYDKQRSVSFHKFSL